MEKKYDVVVDDTVKHILKLEKELKAPLQIFGQIETDRFIFDNDSIKKGYNTKYNVINDTYDVSNTIDIINDLFPMVQLELFNNSYDGSYEKKSYGYVYRIEIDGKNFVDMETKGKSIGDLIKKIYRGEKVNKKYSKLRKLVIKKSYDDIKIECLKRKGAETSKLNLVKLKDKMIIKYNANDENYGLKITTKDIEKKDVIYQTIIKAKKLKKK